MKTTIDSLDIAFNLLLNRAATMHYGTSKEITELRQRFKDRFWEAEEDRMNAALLYDKRRKKQ